MSRFDLVPEGQKHISTYIPLPLDIIMKSGAMKQAQQDKAMEERMDIAGKQFNFLPQDVQSATQAKQEINKTLDEFSNKDFTDPNVKADWYLKKRQLADRFGQTGDIGNMQGNYLAHQKYVGELKNRLEKGPKEGGIDLNTYNKLAEISKNKYQGIGTGETGLYNQYEGIAPASFSDIAAQADTLAKGWKENKKLKEGWAETPDGKLYKKVGNKTEWITPDEIYNNIKPILEADPMNQAYAQQHVMLNTYGKEVPNESKLQLYNELFDKPATFAANKYGYTQTEQTSDIQQSQEYLHNIKKNDLLKSLVGQTIEGQTYNPIANDKDFQTLKDNGVFNVQDDGQVKINWSELTRDNKASAPYTNIGSPSLMGTGAKEGFSNVGKPSKSAEEKQRQLAKQITKMADVVGFKGDIKSDNYELITSAYNILNKARLYGEQLSAPVSNLESNKLTRNWELSTSFDPNNLNKLVEKPILKEGDKLLVTQRQTNEKGNIIKKGVIVSKDGSRTPFAVKSNSIEDSNYFDTIGNIGVTSAKYQVGELKGTGEKTNDGKDVISGNDIPNIGTVYTVGNPRDKSQIEYRLVTNKNEKVRFDNYSDLQRFLESKYYTETPEGISDTNELLSESQQYKENFE